MLGRLIHSIQEAGKKITNSGRKRDDGKDPRKPIGLLKKEPVGTYSKDLADGDLCFSMLPPEVLAEVIQSFSPGDIVRLLGASRKVRELVGYTTECIHFWEKRKTTIEAYLAERRAKYNEVFYPAGEEAYRILTLPATNRHPLRVLCIGDSKLRELCLAKSFMDSMLNNGVDIKIDEHVVLLQEVFGLQKSESIPVETYHSAAVLVLFANNRDEYRGLAKKLLTDNNSELKKKVILLAHPEGVRITSEGLVDVHALYELRKDNCSRAALARAVVGLLQKCSKAYMDLQQEGYAVVRAAAQADASVVHAAAASDANIEPAINNFEPVTEAERVSSNQDAAPASRITGP